MFPNMFNFAQNVPQMNLNNVFGKTMIQMKSYQELLAVTRTLQETVIKQQLILDSILHKQEQIEDKLQLVLTNTKENNPIKVKTESNDTDLAKYNEASDITSMKSLSEHKENNRSTTGPKIIRRNGFKKSQQGTPSSQDEEECSSDEDMSPDLYKPNKGRRNPSKAKHLWINYGRRIVEYGIEKTEGDTQEKIRQLVGRLNSKKDFKDLFEVVSSDSAEEKAFKLQLGKLAIDFVKNKSAASFEGRKYRQQMVNQRHTVAAWIEKLIAE